MGARIFWLSTLLLAGPSFADELQKIEITDPLNYRTSTIDYLSDDTTNVFVRLKSQIERGDVTLKSHGASGYLHHLLEELEVPVESQILVFSRSSLQEHYIRPNNPRALYFNDDVVVGWVPGAPVIEIAAHDPMKGTVFYTVTQSDDSVPAEKTVIKRETSCIDCHSNSATMNVPGYLLRSFHVDEFGDRDQGSHYSDVTHRTPYDKRWGGWYVTGRSEKMVHAGNLFGDEDVSRHENDPSFRGTVMDLTSLVDLTRYPSIQSDIVALLVLDHQMHFYNLVTRVHYEHRLGLHSDAEEQLARYALMEGEVPLPGPVASSSNYAARYQSVGLRDSIGRSLRDLNLQTRLFQHRLSPLVKSHAFQSLPQEVKSRLWERFRKARGEIVELVSASHPTKPSINCSLQP